MCLGADRGAGGGQRGERMHAGRENIDKKSKRIDQTESYKPLQTTCLLSMPLSAQAQVRSMARSAQQADPVPRPSIWH